MCVFLVCVLVPFRASVCAFRASELLVVRLSFVVKLFRLRCVSCEILKFSCRISNSYFKFDSRIRFLEFSKSYFEVEFWIRLFRFVALFDFSNFVALFDFSNFNFRFEFRIQVPWIFVSNLSSKFSFRCSIRFLESRFRFDFSSQVPWISNSSFSSSWSIRLLEFRFEFVVEIAVAPFDFSNFDLWVEFLVWVLNWTLQFSSRVDSKLSFSCLVLKPRFESW